MDERLKTNMDVFLAERHDCVLSKIRRENDSHIALIEKIREAQHNLHIKGNMAEY